MAREVDYNSYTMPNNTPFLKIEQGDNRIRICSKPLEIRYVEIPGDKYATEVLKTEEEEKQAIAMKKKIKTKFAYLVLSRADKKVYIYEASPSVFKQILAYATNPDYGDPTQYDITINKTGEKLATVYTVMPARTSTPFTEEEIQLIALSEAMLTENYK